MSGIGKILLNMTESIASIYYPDSNDPIFEISIDQLVDFLSYFTDRVNGVIDNLLNNEFRLINKFSKTSIKDKKISFVIEMLEKSKEEKEEKQSLVSKVKGGVINIGKKVVFKATEGIINKEFLSIIDTLGEDINKLYSKQLLVNESKGDENV